jgi:hypothetical protein
MMIGTTLLRRGLQIGILVCLIVLARPNPAAADQYCTWVGYYPPDCENYVCSWLYANYPTAYSCGLEGDMCCIYYY